MAVGIQNKTVAAFLQGLGITGYSGIVLTTDGTTNTQLDIACTNAWAVLTDGTLFVAGDFKATYTVSGITGTTTAYTCWLDKDSAGLGKPQFSVSATSSGAPTSSAMAIGSFTNTSGHLPVSGSIVAVANGLLGFPETNLSFSGATTTSAPAAGGASALPATPLGYITVTINAVAQKIAYY